MIRRIATAGLLLAVAAPAVAASLDVEASTDLRRRGIGWSDGRPAIEAYASVPLGRVLSAEIGAATLRGSARHGGAGALGEAALRATLASGPWRLWGDIVGHGFAGGSGPLNYAETRAGVGYSLGPAQLAVQTGWAPTQDAIGGSNFHIGARVSVGIIGTPWTLAASAGHSTGTNDGSGRSERLRPGGDYSDFRIDADYVRGPLTLGVSATSITIDRARIDDPASADDVRPRLLARAALRF